MSDLHDLYRVMGVREMAKAAIKIHRPDLVSDESDTRPHRHIVIVRYGNAATVEPQCTVGKLLFRASKRK